MKLLKQIGVLVTVASLSLGALSAADEVLSDGAFIQGGKVKILKAGQTTEVTEATTLADGTIISPTGEVTRPDGKSMQLREGQRISLSGQVTNPPGVPDRAPNKQ